MLKKREREREVNGLILMNSLLSMLFRRTLKVYHLCFFKAIESLPLKPKMLDMGTAEKIPGGRIRTVFHQKTLQTEQKRENQRRQRPKSLRTELYQQKRKPTCKFYEIRQNKVEKISERKEKVRSEMIGVGVGKWRTVLFRERNVGGLCT